MFNFLYNNRFVDFLDHFKQKIVPNIVQKIPGKLYMFYFWRSDKDQALLRSLLAASTGALIGLSLPVVGLITMKALALCAALGAFITLSLHLGSDHLIKAKKTYDANSRYEKGLRLYNTYRAQMMPDLVKSHDSLEKNLDEFFKTYATCKKDWDKNITRQKYLEIMEQALAENKLMFKQLKQLTNGDPKLMAQLLSEQYFYDYCNFYFNKGIVEVFRFAKAHRYFSKEDQQYHFPEGEISQKDHDKFYKKGTTLNRILAMYNKACHRLEKNGLVNFKAEGKNQHVFLRSDGNYMLDPRIPTWSAPDEKGKTKKPSSYEACSSADERPTQYRIDHSPDAEKAFEEKVQTGKVRIEYLRP